MLFVGYRFIDTAESRIRADWQDQPLHELFATLGKANERVDAGGGDDAAARIEARRRTLLLIPALEREVQQSDVYYCDAGGRPI